MQNLFGASLQIPIETDSEVSCLVRLAAADPPVEIGLHLAVRRFYQSFFPYAASGEKPDSRTQ